MKRMTVLLNHVSDIAIVIDSRRRDPPSGLRPPVPVSGK